MPILRRTILVILVFALPVAVTAILYALATFMLHATNRVISPEILWYATAIELPVFFVFAVLDAKNRW
ncbi:MAG TPA: hypothetical protein VGF97_05705 [Rhizomicrobium sp.]|jgi:hypothetical protein